MLTSGLTSTLVNRGIINKTTRVIAEFEKLDYSNRSVKLRELCTVDRTVQDQDQYYFDLHRVDNGEFLRVSSVQILYIDGMDPTELARAFDLKIDGSKQPQGVRRGRPRKHFPYGFDA